MTQEQAIRERVAKDYAEAVSKPSSSSCCSTDDCCGTTGTPGDVEQKGIAVKSAGYTKGELGSLPDDAVVNSFGCGNPTAFTNVKEGDVVIDLGSGAGIDILLAAKKVGPAGRVIGIDMTDEMIARAEANIATSGFDNVEVRKGIIEDMPVESGTVDWVISNCVINLSPEKPRVFAEIARVLKPGGQMLVSDIVVEELSPTLRENTKLYSGCVAGAISEDQYVQGLKDAELGNVDVIDRIVYERSQLVGFLKSEDLEAAAEGESSCCGGGSCATLTAEQIDTIAQEMTTKVWSATFTARKPL